MRHVGRKCQWWQRWFAGRPCYRARNTGTHGVERWAEPALRGWRGSEGFGDGAIEGVVAGDGAEEGVEMVGAENVADGTVGFDDLEIDIQRSELVVEPAEEASAGKIDVRNVGKVTDDTSETGFSARPGEDNVQHMIDVEVEQRGL